MSRAKRKAMFWHGVEAVQRITGDERTVYYCPICEKPFGPDAAESGKLTLEDVPPKSQGGRPLALTCRPCNNDAGSLLDAAVLAREDVQRFERAHLEGKGEYEGHTVIRAGDAELRVREHTRGDVTKLHVVEGQNDPAEVERFREGFLEAEQGDIGPKMSITLRKHRSLRQAELGDLRTAYLVAFAAFGYTWAFNASLDPVRAQLQKPQAQILENGFTARAHVSTSDHDLLAAHAPWPCVVVQMPGRIVVLPWPGCPDDLYEQTGEAFEQLSRFDFKARRLPWPDRLRMDLDLGRDPTSE